MIRFLATTPASSDDLFSDVLPVVAVLVIVVLFGSVLIYIARRAVKASEQDGPGDFTLQDLRDLHSAGKLSDVEFERAKQLMIGRLTAPEPSEERPGDKPGNVIEGNG